MEKENRKMIKRDPFEGHQPSQEQVKPPYHKTEATPQIHSGIMQRLLKGYFQSTYGNNPC